MRTAKKIALSTLGLVVATTLACQTTSGGGGGDLDLESGVPLNVTADAYRAYERGDCDEVAQRRADSSVQTWPANEARSSFLLVSGFCAEQDGKIDRARNTYRQLLREAPLSFAADDARERLRVLRLRENDPGYGDWVAAARDRATLGSTDRAPLERAPASYPPLAQVAQIGGWAVVEFGVTPRGDTDAPVIVDSDPPLLFDGAALRAVREWRYAQDADGTKSERQAIRLVFRPDEAEPLPDLDAPVESATN